MRGVLAAPEASTSKRETHPILACQDNVAYLWTYTDGRETSVKPPS